MKEAIYEIRTEFYQFHPDGSGNKGTGLAVYIPLQITERAKIAVLAMHQSNYMGFYPMVEMAKRGYIAAGILPRTKGNIEVSMEDCDDAIQLLKDMHGVEKVVLMGHSQGGCLLSCYQYLAENGNGRFLSQDRLIPFPNIRKLTPADGLMLMDANYGIMRVLALDPAVRTLDNGYSRIPELDLYNPENGYVPGASRYSDEFIQRFQKAQIDYYRELLSYAAERYEKIKKGRGMFLDDEPLVIPGAGGGSRNNKLFCQDTRLLGHTAAACDILHPDGSITRDIAYTVRPRVDSVSSACFNRGASSVSVLGLLRNEQRFTDFGYDECHMWGMDEDFNYLSTRANVKGIHVPLLLEGNTASHEFINMEMTYELAASEDKMLIMLEGSRHSFEPVEPKYGDTLGNIADYLAKWIAHSGRFFV